MPPGLPDPLRAYGEPAAVEVTTDGLVLRAGARTDLFVDPADLATTLNAPRLLTRISGDFTLAARLSVEFGETFDAGALLIWYDDGYWAKLAHELSPAGEPTVVSVVTRETSDDCNGLVADAMWLRIARLGSAYAFHASADGNRWALVRYFTLDRDDDPWVGFEAQSPLGSGAQARFSEVGYRPGRLTNLRDGS